MPNIKQISTQSRMKKSFNNSSFSLLYKGIDAIMGFVLRTIFINTLGKTYLGLSGLFANILTVLSLMELGIGGAIVYALYEPLAQNNKPKIVALMQLYKKTYTIIGILVSVIGVCLTPFLKYILKLPQNVDGIYIIYWLTIANTSVTYFLSYKRSLLLADQRSDINSKNLILYRFTRFFILIATMYLTKNYFLYLVLDFLNTLASNIHINILVNRKYDYLKTEKIIPIEKAEKRNIIKYISSGILFKMGQTVVNSTDNILISAFISTVLVALYSNYSMITGNLEVIIYLVFNGITASIGNYAVCNSENEAESLFKKVFFANFCVSFVSSICLLSLLSPFIQLWAGTDYLLSNATVIILIINYYIVTLQKSCDCFMSAVGEMFYKNRYRGLVEAIVNLLVSILLVKYTDWGITGIFLGTTACFLVGRVWMDPKTLYKYWFHGDYKKYMLFYIGLFVLTAVSAFVGVIISGQIFQHLGVSIVSWILVAALLLLFSFVIIIVVFHKTQEYKYFIGLIKKHYKR